MPTVHRIFTTVGLFTMPLIVGCAASNERSVIGDATEIPAISASGSPEPLAADDGPSLSSLDRSAWARTQVLVPVDGAYHQPTYRHDYREMLFTARQRGEFPTPETALELDGKPERAILGEEIAESGGGAIVAALDGISMPVQILLAPPTTTRRSPRWNYQRWPAPVTATTVPAATEPTSVQPDTAQPAPAQSTP